MFLLPESMIFFARLTRVTGRILKGTTGEFTREDKLFLEAEAKDFVSSLVPRILKIPGTVIRYHLWKKVTKMLHQMISSRTGSLPGSFLRRLVGESKGEKYEGC
jgi:hypothetical protein